MWNSADCYAMSGTPRAIGATPGEAKAAGVAHFKLAETMTQFSSLLTVPAETRRTLRQRFHRCIPATYVHPAEQRGSTNVTDELFLQLLLNLTVEYAATLEQAHTIYSEAQGHDSTEVNFDDLIDKGWIQVIWGRISIPTDVAIVARNSSSELMPSFLALVEQRFCTSNVWSPEVSKDTLLIDLVNRIDSGDLRIDDIYCQTPSWVAARLWDRSYSMTSEPSQALRLWVDRWNLLGSPHIEIARAWNEPARTAFRESIFYALAEDNGICTFEDFRNELINRVTLTTGRDLASSDDYVPSLPASLIERALWLRNPSIERLVDEKYLQLEEYAHLIYLLEAEITNTEYSSAPHPTFLRLADLALDRAPVFLSLLMHAQRNPSLIVELLLHPPTSAVACLLIAQWQAPTSAWDRALLDKDNQSNRLIAFSDAVSVLQYHLNKENIHTREVALLLRWLHDSVRINTGDRKTSFEEMLARFSTELVRLPQSTIGNIIEILLEDTKSMCLGAANFHAALDAISVGRLADEIDPMPLAQGYLTSFAKDEAMLSAAGVTPRMAVALHTLAKRMPEEVYHNILSPVNIIERLSACTEENQFTLERAIGQAIRLHIRILCRMVIGLSTKAPEAIFDALTSAIRTGAVTDLEAGRVGAFSPNFESRSFFESQDRTIAADMGGALSAIAESDANRLADAILETDEPTVLAELLVYCPIAIQKRIRDRITEIAPDDAAPTYSLDEVQVRIDALLAAGLGEIAEEYLRVEMDLRTWGKVPGRRTVRFRQSLRAKLLREDWRGINGAELPEDLSPQEQETSRETLAFYQAVAALNNPAADRSQAVELFSRLHRRSSDVAAYAINLFLAHIGRVLEDGLFEILDDHRTVEAENVLADGEINLQKIRGLSKADAEVYACYRALLLLSLGKAAQAHEILNSIESVQLRDTAIAFDSVAVTRLGRQPEAVVMLNEATRTFGETRHLRAAKAYIESGSGTFQVLGVTPDDQLIPATKEALTRLKQMDPLQQAQVLRPWSDPFAKLVTDLIVSATSSVENLVPAMRNLALDSYEDDITALVRELLTGQLELLDWHVADHSREGWSARGNPGKPDLVLRRGSTTLSAVEAVVCRDAIREDNLRAHFHKLFGYSSCSVNFLLTYTFRDVSETVRRLRLVAESNPPEGFKCVDVVDLATSGSAPRGFYAIYSNGMGPIRVVFLILDLNQGDRRTAAASAVVGPA